MMFCVYYSKVSYDSVTPYAVLFEDMGMALKFANAMRNDPQSKFITMASEIEGNCTLMGVSEPSKDYDWKKRRI
jgi:hypothetical protein